MTAEREGAHDAHRQGSEVRERKPLTADSNPQELSLTLQEAILPGSLFADPVLRGRGNAPVREAAIQRAQQTFGNRATRRFLQRMPGACNQGVVGSRPTATSSPLPIQRTPRGTRPDAPASELTTPDLTGYYESSDGGQGAVTLQVNQAGNHLVAWMEERNRGAASQVSLRRSEIIGTLSARDTNSVTYTYRRNAGRSRPIPGGLSAESSGPNGRDVILVISESDGSFLRHFRRVSAEARPTDDALSRIAGPTGDLVRAAETTPLHSAEDHALQQSAQAITRQIREFFSAPDRVDQRGVRASQLNTYIRTMMRAYSPEQHILVRRRLYALLTDDNELEVRGVTRPYWDWLQILTYTERGMTPDIQRDFDIHVGSASVTIDESTPQHSYTYEYLVFGFTFDVGLGLSIMRGTMRIRKVRPDADAWSSAHEYPMTLGGLSLGLSVGVSVGSSNSGEMVTPFPYAINDFIGPVELHGANGPAAAVGAGAGYTPSHVSNITFMGSGSFPPITADAGGVSGAFGIFASGLELGASTGYLGGDGQRQSFRHSFRPPQQSQSARHRARALVHFDIDDPSLTEAGRQAIRELCALHRRLLTSQDTTVSVTGYASTTGGDARNLQLSELRAQNTLQAIRDMLGTQIRGTSRGLGEAPARRSAQAAGQPADNFEDDAWRKVEVAANGQILLTLRY